MVQKFLLALWSRGGLITSVFVVFVAKAPIARNPQFDVRSHWPGLTIFGQEGVFAELASKTHESNWQDRNPRWSKESANHTLAKKGSKSIGIAGWDGKQCITQTFTVWLKGGFLPMQLIYGGKTN